MTETRYSLAADGVFRTVLGEGALTGLPATFVRLAGCSVACPECDTDYTAARRIPVRDLLREVANVTQPGDWVWLTGGEPFDRDLYPLADGLRDLGFRVAVATSGHKPVSRQWAFDWISVSPHDPAKWFQRAGHEVKLVAGLNGVPLSAWEPLLPPLGNFGHRFACPCHGRPETVDECVAWVEKHRDWRMGAQAHRLWLLP